MTLMIPDIVIDREVKLGNYDTLEGHDTVYYVEGKQVRTGQRWAYLQIYREHEGVPPYRLQPYGWTRIGNSKVKRVTDVSRQNDGHRKGRK